MADVINDRDTLLLGSPQRANNPLSADIILSLSAPGFTVNNSVGLPSSINVSASLIQLIGTVSFSATGTTLTDNGDNTATILFENTTDDEIRVTASLTSNGEVFTKFIEFGKTYSGEQGPPGMPGNKSANVFLYQFATSLPEKPTGTSGYTWSTGVNSTYSDNDGWSVVVPTNPGGPNTKLYVAATTITAPWNTASTVVSYDNSNVAAWTQNGIDGEDGVSGVQSAIALVYQWAPSIPTGPVGSATYKWSDGTYSAPSGWYITPPNPTSQGVSLWAARVSVVDSAVATQTTFNWVNASIYVAGSSGANGTAGPSGASYVTAYAASTSVTATGTPAATTGKDSVPAANGGGIIGIYSKTVPDLVEGQRMFQVDGVYDPTTNQVTWSVPYWSVFKVGSLSAITANMGDLNVTGTIAVQPGGEIIVGNASSGVVMNSGGLLGRKAGVRQFEVDNEGNAYFAGHLGANTVTAESIAAGAITTRSLLVSSDNGNLVRDAMFRDLAWWGMAGKNISPVEWGSLNSGWKNNASAYFGSTGGVPQEASTVAMPIVAGAVYLVEYQIGISSDFEGEVAIEWHLPYVSYYNYEQPARQPVQTFPSGAAVQYDYRDRAVRRNVSKYITIPANTALTNSNIRICWNVRAGNFELGGFNITRVSDSVLIQDGAITANKISVSTLSAITANIGLLRTATSGQRMELDSNNLRCMGPSNQLLGRFGVW